jgi:hypothetical protein
MATGVCRATEDLSEFSIVIPGANSAWFLDAVGATSAQPFFQSIEIVDEVNPELGDKNQLHIAPTVV